MTVPTYSAMELAIRSAWAGAIGDAVRTAGPDTDGVIVEQLELLATAPFAYKNAQAAVVRGQWVRAGGVVPVTPHGGIANPLDQPASWPFR